MNWIYFAITAYLLLAVSGIVDKFLVSRVVKQPVAYAFYISVTAPFSLLLAPFGLQWLSLTNFAIAFLAGIGFILGIYYYFHAVQKSSVSRVLPVMGGMVPLFTLVFAFWFLGERLASTQYFAFIFLVFGSVIISFKKEPKGWRPAALGYAIAASAAMALSAVLSKHIFEVSNFITGMVWTRIGFLFMTGFFLLSPLRRKHIFQAPKDAKVKNIALYYTSRFSGTIAGFLQNYAVAIGSVTIVNAMQGTQFVFLLLLATFLSIKFPKVIKEHVTAEILSQKVAAVIMISVGLILLAI